MRALKSEAGRETTVHKLVYRLEVFNDCLDLVLYLAVDELIHHLHAIFNFILVQL